MSTIYLCIVIFLLCLAVFDLFVGVSNDAVNFLQSAVGAKVAHFRTVLIIASCGVAVGAVMSSGMMDVARHGILMPVHYSFEEVMTIFLAVMVTDVLILDVFNTLGMPTSTTVSLVFELLGGTFILATVKTLSDNGLDYGDLLNSSQALKTIFAIFVSVAIAFFFGVIVMWISRVIFTFNYKKHSRYSIAIFGGIAFTALAYFIFLKGLGKSPYIPASTRDYIQANTDMLLIYTFVISTVLMEVLHLIRVNIFKLVVLMGTFALAMAFAGNDLVNFIGVPLAGLDSYQDFMANGNGASPSEFMMSSLMESAKTPPFFLLGAGVVMIIAMATSKKAQNVIKTSVDLSRQDEGDEMFGSSSAARSIVRFTQNGGSWFEQVVPIGVQNWINGRFNKSEAIIDEGAAFDVVRASVNLVLAAMLITIGTNYKLPLSTTYVTFMVAMGSSLADAAWSRESAVFRVTGVLSVIGGWFITAGVAFIACAVVCLAMFYGGIVVQALAMGLVVFSLIRSNRNFAKKVASESKTSIFNLMMRTRDPELVWDMLRRHVSKTQSFVNHFAQTEFNRIADGFANQDVRALRRSLKELRNEQGELKKYRRQELLGLKRSPVEIAIERNTWFHLGANSDQQFIYCLRRMLDPIKEHVDNNFNPLPAEYAQEFESVRRKINDLMQMAQNNIDTNNYEDYRNILAEADACKDELSLIRKRHIDRIQQTENNKMLQVSLVYLNFLQESQEFLSIMRHQLRAAKKFMEN
ncbi:MAG: inorganic phosphate transporter [Prevotella sp.]|nr:inorganic phosphate transporter [Prevotella sp.]